MLVQKVRNYISFFAFVRMVLLLIFPYKLKNIHLSYNILRLLHLSVSDMPMFYIKYLTMHKVHMHAGAIRQLLYGCAYVREIIHSL